MLEEKEIWSIIDLSGPCGNAYYLLGKAKEFSEILGLDSEIVLEQMKSSDYEHLVEVFKYYFGEYVRIYSSR
jgi:hypothetical protein